MFRRCNGRRADGLRTAGITRIVATVIAALAAISSVCSTAHALDDAELRDRVIRAIARGREYLIAQQANDGSWSASLGVAEFRNGTTGLAILALLNSGMKEDDPPVAKGLKYLRGLRDDELESTSRQKPYELSLMLQALAAVKGKDRGRIAKLAELLVAYQKSNGGWRYDPPSGPGDDSWDNSVNQFALLGLREAAMTGYPVDQKVWLKAQELVLQNQIGGADAAGGNGWSYTPGEPNAYGGMTVAGMSSLIITSSMLQQDQNVGADGRIDCCGASGDERVRKALKSGERWLGTNFSVTDNPARPGYFYLYYLYGLERAGRFGGVRFYGDHDWYREGATHLVSAQNQRTGSWANPGGRGPSFAMVDTCFALLYLSKGLAPVVINKIEFGTRDLAGRVTSQDWNRHPRDVANLVDSLTTRTGWPQFLNWQTVDLEKAANGEGVAALLQAPVQLISGTLAPDTIQGKQVDLLREYVNQGGFILAMQNCENTEFDIGIRTLVGRMFPGKEYELKKLPATHDIYRSEAVFAANPPELWGVDFGCRTAIVYAPFDHACRWQKWTKYDIPGRRPDVKSQIAQSMNLGVNIIAYATNRELVSKLDRPTALTATGADETAPRSAIEIARLRHTGGWDAAPHALRHLQGSLEKLGYLMATTSPNVPATDEALRNYPIAYMHGRKNFAFNQEERNGLRGYAENGGVLIADACCGSTQFDTSFRDMIAQTFGKQLEKIPLTHELYNMQPLGHDIRRVERRIPTTQQSGSLASEPSMGEPILEGIKIGERYVVIYSKYDISCALEQQNTQTCAGYSRLDAARIAANMVIYAMAQ
ncbi:MAG TPA: DUF4159 domain-containing protein [Caulifigura sp.]|nr:DUF4159 domain-containing protein [Caulifigura sp.]